MLERNGIYYSIERFKWWQCVTLRNITGGAGLVEKGRPILTQIFFSTALPRVQNARTHQSANPASNLKPIAAHKDLQPPPSHSHSCYIVNTTTPQTSANLDRCESNLVDQPFALNPSKKVGTESKKVAVIYSRVNFPVKLNHITRWRPLSSLFICDTIT